MDKHKRTKIKNDNIQRWQLELVNFGYDIYYCLGCYNVVGDTLNWVFMMPHLSHPSRNYMIIHIHPGNTQLLHYAHSKNMPFFIEEVKEMSSFYWTCAEMIPQFATLPLSYLYPSESWSYLEPIKIRSLLSIKTNATPHERFFSYLWWSLVGVSLPSWLLKPVFLYQFLRHSKNDLLVQEIKLLDVNPTYVHIRYGDGHKLTVSLRDLVFYPSV